MEGENTSRARSVCIVSVRDTSLGFVVVFILFSPLCSLDSFKTGGMMEEVRDRDRRKQNRWDDKIAWFKRSGEREASLASEPVF